MYSLKISKQAAKFLKSGKIPEDDLILIDKKILSLAVDPYQPGVKKIKGKKGYIRARAGNYRIIYTVEGRRLIVFIIGLGDRKDIYRIFG